MGVAAGAAGVAAGAAARCWAAPAAGLARPDLLSLARRASCCSLSSLIGSSTLRCLRAAAPYSRAGWVGSACPTANRWESSHPAAASCSGWSWWSWEGLSWSPWAPWWSEPEQRLVPEQASGWWWPSVVLARAPGLRDSGQWPDPGQGRAPALGPGRGPLQALPTRVHRELPSHLPQQPVREPRCPPAPRRVGRRRLPVQAPPASWRRRRWWSGPERVWSRSEARCSRR